MPSFALLPFSTDLLADFLEFRIAVLVYWLNLLMLGAALFSSWWYADRNGMIAEDVDAEMRRTVYSASSRRRSCGRSARRFA